MAEKHKNLFEDLGKPTLRGVRKCPKCGTFNGTRGISCKNKECRLIFKIPKEKTRPEPEVDAVKIICNSNLQIYSVRLQEISNYHRCFVHLPLIEGIEALQDTAEITIIKQSAAMCYSPICRKPMDDMCTITLNLNPCAHTHSVVNCLLEAQPLLLKKGIMKAIPVSEEMKQEIFSLASKSEEHLVQRITKNTFVVKCIPDDKQPLGFLHFSVFEPVKKSKKFKILCECQSQFNKPFIPREKQMCIHFYICLCAFASDPALIDEFKSVIQYILTLKSPDLSDSSTKLSTIDTQLKNLKDFFSEDVTSPSKKTKVETLNTDDIIVVDENNTIKSVKTQKKVAIPGKKKPSPNEVVVPSINFDHWLASVTERINQTMHYQFSGSPEPLIFHVPQPFFDVLQQRISSGSKKKRLPNAVVAFTKKDALPIGVFSKYTWHITNILHVKRIFDTVEVPLEVTRSFIENRDGTYVPYNPAQQETSNLAENFRKTLNNLLIKPLELKTFMKVGTMTLDQKEPTPFIIEWIPDILPKTHVGELRIKFEYGHQRNGVIEKHQLPVHNVNQPSTESINSSV